ncbi:MAG: hypothetical protein KJ042_00180 [Deltaproteobacteria bacterium]|nr:hypothetical protein [Deltaproteobacteria bacterium]
MSTIARHFFFLFLVVFAIGCGCGDDDDDDSGGPGDDDTDDDDDDDADDDDVADVDSAEDVARYIVEELGATGANGSFMAYIVTEPLAAGDAIAPAEGTSAFTPSGAYWFAYLDDDPFAAFEHDVRYLFIDDATGEVTVEAQSWWPELNGETLWASDVSTLNLFKAEEPFSAAKSAAGGGITPQDDAADGDYGDAPDDTDAYQGFGGAVAGKFPTLHDTANSVDDRPGGHTLNVGDETLGSNVSIEDDADDADDPDGTPNLVDRDADDRKIYWAFYPDYANKTLDVRFLVNVAVAANAPDTERHINILVDQNRDGEWKKNAAGDEWLVKNFAVDVAPGTDEWLWTDSASLPLGAANKFGWEQWIRVALTRETIDDAPFGANGWDGSGEFEYGEIEDHYFNFTPWNGPGDGGGGGGDDDSDDDSDDDADDDGGGDDDDNPGPENPGRDDPGEGVEPKECVYICEEDQIEIPISCKALVINLGDHEGADWMKKNGKNAEDFYNARLGDGNVERLDRPTAEDALDAIKDFINSSVCLDELHIYITGHGSKDGWIRAQNGKGKLKVSEIDEILDAKPHCPSPMNYYAGECRQDGFCNLNFVIQSCYSGNFLEGDDSLKRDGVNTLTSASKSKSSYAKSDGDGSELSGSYWDAWENNQADDPPNGDDNGEVSNEEAMEWAKNNMGGPDSDPQTNFGADCECVCSMPEDPPDDEDWWDDSGGDPPQTPFLDILSYATVFDETGVTAMIDVEGELPDAGPGQFEWYMLLDAGPSAPNDPAPGRFQGADVFMVLQYNNGVFNLLLFKYNAGAENWQPVVDPGGETNHNGTHVVMHFPYAILGLTPGDMAPFRAATWGLQDESQYGDDTEWINYSDRRFACLYR